MFGFLRRRQSGSPPRHPANRLPGDPGVRNAEAEAEALVGEAAHQAEKIVREANLFTRQVRQDLLKTLKDAVGELADEHQAELKNVRGQFAAEFSQLVSRLEEAAQKDIASFSAAARTRLKELEQELASQAAEQQASLAADLKQIKEQRLAALEKTLTAELPVLVRDLIGRTISLDAHEEIVRERLAELRQKPLWQ